MKKFTSIVVVLLLCALLTAALIGCNDNNDNGSNGDKDAGSGNVASGNESNDDITSGDVAGSGDIGSGSEDVNTGSNEIGEFRRVMEAVLNEFSGRINDSSVKSATAPTSVTSARKKGVETPSALQDVFDYMDGSQEKQLAESDRQLNAIALKNFITVLAYGELIVKVCGMDSLYGLPIEIVNADNTVPKKSYAIIRYDEGHIKAYLYGSDDSIGELIYAYDINFALDGEFTAKMSVMSGGKLTYYVYGDTDENTLLLMNNVVMYKKAGSDDCYQSDNMQVLSDCYDKVASETDFIDFELIRSLEESCEYSTSYEQLDEIVDRLSKSFGVN